MKENGASKMSKPTVLSGGNGTRLFSRFGGLELGSNHFRARTRQMKVLRMSASRAHRVYSNWLGRCFFGGRLFKHPSADYLKAVDEVAWLLKEVNVAMENDDLEVKVAGGGTKQRPAKRRKVR